VCVCERERERVNDGWEGREPNICWWFVVERHGATTPPRFRSLRQNHRMSGTIFSLISVRALFGCREYEGKGNE
jgi:hypothetical protein